MLDTTLQTLPDFYTWGFAGAPIQIHLKIELVSRLRKQIQDSALGGTLPACGLLTGETFKPGVTTILDFKPLQTLDALSAGEAGARPGVVGFYRTTPVGLDSMPDEHKALAQRFFNDPSSVFLLIETGESSIGDARFCFWSERQIFDFPVMTFPFDAAELAAREVQRRSAKAAASLRSTSTNLEDLTFAGDEELPAPVLESRTSPAVAKRKRTSLRWWLVPALGIVVIAAVLAAVLLNSRRGFDLPAASQAATPPVELPAPLGLSVERRGSDLRVSWNGNAEKISKADFGMLLIRGTGVSRDVPLTAEELRAGSVLYASAVDQLRFQLTVVAGGQVAREFLTIVMPQDPGTPANRPNLPVPPAANLVAREAPRPAAATRAAPPREFRQLNARPDPASTTHPGLEEPPPVSGAAPVNGSTPSLLNHLPVSPGAPPAPVVAPAPGTSQPSQSEDGARPPVATSQVVPPVPALLRGMIWKATAVDVNVAVDATGKVVKAEAAAKPGVHPLLREAAVQAALRWKFQPAQFDGHPVPANIVLQFNFAANR